jgi:hypothetical protein
MLVSCDTFLYAEGKESLKEGGDDPNPWPACRFSLFRFMSEWLLDNHPDVVADMSAKKAAEASRKAAIAQRAADAAAKAASQAAAKAAAKAAAPAAVSGNGKLLALMFSGGGAAAAAGTRVRKSVDHFSPESSPAGGKPAKKPKAAPAPASKSKAIDPFAAAGSRELVRRFVATKENEWQAISASLPPAAVPCQVARFVERLLADVDKISRDP